ncbi:MAG: pilus assembly protein PilE [Firmicutes bacterium HGW-Firmicutes-15]|nr:MAG: pilus assembly protein PilE [Firmicutes bacterium HGW-Firmicutes-15]
MIKEIVKRKENQKGFTLLELIIVMAILTVLAAIAIPKYTGVLDDSKKKANIANIKMIEEAADLYMTNEVDNTALKTGDISTSTHTLLDKKYLKAIPKDPKNNDVYTITRTGDQIVVTPKVTAGYN